MNHCAMRQQNAFAAREEIRAPFTERRPPVFCPKPRRLSQFSTAIADPLRTPLRCHSNYQIDFSDSKAGADLLDIFLRKGEDQTQVASSPPFFCGSPPSRAANPVIHDARFGDDRPPPPALFPPSSLTQPNPLMSPKQGRVHAKIGLVPAAVRVEGFDCLNRRRRSHSSITAVA